MGKNIKEKMATFRTDLQLWIAFKMYAAGIGYSASFIINEFIKTTLKNEQKTKKGLAKG